MSFDVPAQGIFCFPEGKICHADRIDAHTCHPDRLFINALQAHRIPAATRASSHGIGSNKSARIKRASDRMLRSTWLVLTVEIIQQGRNAARIDLVHDLGGAAAGGGHIDVADTLFHARNVGGGHG